MSGPRADARLRECLGRRGARTLGALALLAIAGCDQRQAMYDQPKYRPLQASDFFADGMASRAPVAGTIARGQLEDDPHRFAGRVNGRHAAGFPFAITPAILQRGRERYQIFCMPCHDHSGSGNGAIVQRGFKQPVSFHDRFLVNAPEGRLYLAIMNGFGMMDGLAAQIPVDDRWAIVAYIRVLQRDQSALLAEESEAPRADSNPR